MSADAELTGQSALADVTVVVPVWDSYVERFLADALDSLEREAKGARVVIVDNASTVPVPERPSMALVRSRKRLTAGGARNLGLEAVVTPLVVFWDADDVMMPDALDVLSRRLRTRPDAIAVVSVILEAPHRRHHWPRPRLRPLARLPRLFALVHSVSSLFPTTGSVLLRTDCVRDAGGFPDRDGGDDWVLGASLAFRGAVLFDSHPGRLYRRHPDSISSSWRPTPDMTAHAAAVRARLRADPAVPGWARRLAPALVVLQFAVIFVLRPLRRPWASRGRARAA
jgi:hypothetical protein